MGCVLHIAQLGQSVSNCEEQLKLRNACGTSCGSLLSEVFHVILLYEVISVHRQFWLWGPQDVIWGPLRMRDMILPVSWEERFCLDSYPWCSDFIFCKTSALFSAEFWAKTWLVLVSEAVAWDGCGQRKGWRQGCAGGSGDPGDAEGFSKWGKWEEEQVLEGYEGPVADFQVGKQASLLFLKNSLVLLNWLVLTLSKITGSLLQPTIITIPHSLEMKMGKSFLKLRGITVQWKRARAMRGGGYRVTASAEG